MAFKNRLVLLQAVFYRLALPCGMVKSSKRSFVMKSQIELEYEEFEAACRKIISTVLFVCEAELAKSNNHEKALPHAAMAVRESLLAFLALTSQK